MNYRTEQDTIYKYDQNSRNYRTLVTAAKHLKLPDDPEKEVVSSGDDGEDKTTAAPKSLNTLAVPNLISSAKNKSP